MSIEDPWITVKELYKGKTLYFCDLHGTPRPTQRTSWGSVDNFCNLEGPRFKSLLHLVFSDMKMVSKLIYLMSFLSQWLSVSKIDLKYIYFLHCQQKNWTWQDSNSRHLGLFEIVWLHPKSQISAIDSAWLEPIKTIGTQMGHARTWIYLTILSLIKKDRNFKEISREMIKKWWILGWHVFH